MSPLVRRTTIALLVLPLLAGACGSGQEVGGGVNKNLKDASAARLGGSTTTVTSVTTPPSTAAKTGLGVGQTTVTTKAPVTVPPTAPPTTKAAVATTVTTVAPAQQKVALEIAINSDSGAKTQFDPNAGRVFVGSQVKFTNTDTVARSIVDDKATFQSPAIPPGGTFLYTAKTVGTLNYHDGTRPYAVGTLDVVAR